MPCESCAVQFTMFKRKRVCCECDRYYCNNCLGRSVGVCGACSVLSSRPLGRHSLDHLRVRDLQCYLHRQNISTRGCVEKEDLINLVLAHVNSGDFSRRAPPHHSQSDFSSTFASIKGFTSNLNNILSSAFDLGPDHGDRSHARSRQHNNGSRNPGRGGGTTRQDNGPSSRSRMSPPASSTVPPVPTSTPAATASPRMSPGTPSGEPNRGQFQNQSDSRVPTPVTSPQQSTARQATGVPPNLSYATPTPNINISSTSRTRVDYSNLIPQCIVTDTSAVLEIDDDSPLGQRNTTDCVEIEDLDDDDWEILGQIADPLPQESAEIISDASTPIPTPLRSTARATSELNIPSRIADDLSGESSSLKETKFCTPKSISKRIQLDDIKNLTEVESLNVKQLKELLILNRVDFKGCCERNELLERAKRLWRENTKSREDLEKASADELCKICMDAPMECVMLECGHIATCIACGKRLSECPICRQYVIRVVRFFRS